jgi:hypothetical protein
VSMDGLSSSKGPFWWDRDFDASGKPIRADVRVVAREIWNDACQQARALLGEPCEASGLMETSVLHISRYVDRRAESVSAQDIKALLMCAFGRGLRRRARKLRRIHLAGSLSDIAALHARSCIGQEDFRLDADKAARQLSKRGRKMYELRHAGFEWKEIAKLLNTTDAAARTEFSRELRNAKRRLERQRALLRSNKKPKRDTDSSGEQRR